MTQRTIWHASPHAFEKPTIEDRQDNGHAANSGLGLFAATGPHEYISGFGEFIYEITLESTLRARQLAVDEMHRMGFTPEGDQRDRQWFEIQRREWAQESDLVELVEGNGRVMQVILLRDEVIASCKRMTREEFADIAVGF